ncbi:hypothetical protein CLV51_11061 [Chitinophaga niastensis]|uniref:Uncharacterized protein n=1 Tax=Chitinophaga niastensis TaxID=536980 RepID=A0A2P8H9E3_CHINA|nr:hypothetical protein CLV51_11061 [Chitinophaga niastensis]
MVGNNLKEIKEPKINFYFLLVIAAIIFNSLQHLA